MDTPKVDGSLYNQQNAVFHHDFHHVGVHSPCVRGKNPTSPRFSRNPPDSDFQKKGNHEKVTREITFETRVKTRVQFPVWAWITPTLGYLSDVLFYPEGPDISEYCNYFLGIPISRPSDFPGRMFLPPQQRDIWLQRVKNRLTGKKGHPESRRQHLESAKCCFHNDFHHVCILLS